MTRALLLGREPGADLGVRYVRERPWDAVVIGSLNLGELLHFDNEAVLTALAQGKQVLLYTPGLPESPGSRALAGSLASAQRQLKSWGVEQHLLSLGQGRQHRLIVKMQQLPQVQ